MKDQYGPVVSYGENYSNGMAIWPHPFYFIMKDRKISAMHEYE
jgi:hypothetical protein